ncbi:ABC transporter ATP-binding protein [Pseudonocardia acaciae]|uniref:ABC transporter ATP-binding protein n=1 Tax=Pseudonocardia acaciae TaxID=551276 RepID=UPI00068466B9|nr:ABC transporter ATP-binding protein [Pseudonocardia acaciae]
MSRLSFEGVRKDFGRVTAVAEFDLKVDSGEAIVLLGPSGCGKTTTLRMVAGFERPTEGQIRIGSNLVAGPNVFVPPSRREVGVVFQSYALWPHMTVADNVGFGLTVRRRRSGAKRSANLGGRVARALEQVRLDEMGSRYPHELSGGQQQRVALARALVTTPRVLLLDEPLSNLDSRLREEMRLEIRRLQREFAITMIYITHDRTEALALADRIVALNAGNIQQVGPPKDLYRAPGNRFVARSLGSANFLPGVIQDGPDQPAVRLGTGQLLTGVVDAGSQRRPGDVVTLCVRPPDLELSPLDGPMTPWSGVVRDAVFLGDEVHYLVDVPALGEPCRVVDRGIRPLARGARVSVAVAKGGASLLADDSRDADGHLLEPEDETDLPPPAAPPVHRPSHAR